MPLDLTTRDRVKSLLNSGGIDVGSAMDALIDQMIPAYSAHVEKYLGRKTEQTVRTEVFDIEPLQRVIILDAYPVFSVTSVKYDANRDFASVDAEDTDDYYVNKFRGTIDLDVQYASGCGVLQIIHESGMATSTGDFITSYSDIVQALDFQIAYVLSRKDQLGSTAIGLAAGNVGYAGAVDLLPEVKRILDLHRRLVV